MDAQKQQLRQLPKIDALVAQARSKDAKAPTWALTEAARHLVDHARHRILAGETAEITADAVVSKALDLVRPPLRGVINATGVVLHTNLGRAPLSVEALAATEVAGGYCNLELDLATGKRGSRHEHAAGILRSVCGAEDACVVNNNAGAVMLALAGIAAGREVIVSRGELVEIGGSFRVPDVMELSRAKLVEVGTTNKTRSKDYESAITPDTALLLKVHQANFEIVGFTEETSVAELAALGAENRVPSMMDLGSGSLMTSAELSALGLAGEPTVQETLAAGIDLVSFSCDKLLGGPQAGVIAGRKDLVAAARRHPLMRALRPDKLTLATLCATLELYRSGRESEIPAVAMLRAAPEEIRARAESVMSALGGAGRLQLVECKSTAGGGAKPTSALPSWGLAVSGHSADEMSQILRDGEQPVLARIEDEKLILDLRCVAAEEMKALESGLRSVLEESS